MENYTFLPTEEYVRPLGRTVMEDDCRLLSLSASGVEFTYFGTALSVTLYGDSSTEAGEDEPVKWKDQPRIAILVDGKEYINRTVSHRKEILRVCEDFPDEEPKQHVIRILKLSEPRMSTVGLGELTVTADGPARPTPQKERFIEFIGDSITCGYGIDTANENYPFSTATENAAKAYSYLTAEYLGADASLVSYSGHGLISGYTADPSVPKKEELLQPYYEIFSYSYNTFRGRRNQDLPWNFEAERRPDTIVINLGTNDESYCGTDPGKRAEFERLYTEFLKQVHRRNPEAKLVVAFGLMGDSLYENEVRAAEAFQEETGFTDIRTFRISPQNADKNGYASCWHPSAESHREAARELAEFLKNI